MRREVRADMAASVWKVVSEPGMKVGEDDPLVVLESMKMEIPVSAECEGVVVSIDVAAGDVVEDGTLIAVVDTGG